MLLKGQERLHFTHERASRRGRILTAFTGLDLTARVHDARRLTGRDARRAREECLDALVADVAPLRPRRLVVERDESVLEHDRRVLFRAVRKHGLEECLTYDLLEPKLEPLPWVPDALAGSWAKGGDWKARVAPLVTTVTVL